MQTIYKLARLGESQDSILTGNTGRKSRLETDQQDWETVQTVYRLATLRESQDNVQTGKIERQCTDWQNWDKVM